MNPLIFIFGISSFLLSLFIHIFLWRWKCPKNDVLALFSIFFFIPILAALLYVGLTPYPSLNLIETLLALVLSLSLSSAYIQTYPAVQASSPSLVILILIGESMPHGLSVEDLKKYFTNVRLVADRTGDLKNTNLIKEMNHEIQLTLFGKILISTYILFRKILGLPLKGGG